MFLTSVPTPAQEKSEDLDKLFTYYYENARFSGIVLAAENGRVNPVPWIISQLLSCFTRYIIPKDSSFQ